ncbi:metal-dependent protein hydrolase, partial [Kipferlia bialata]
HYGKKVLRAVLAEHGVKVSGTEMNHMYRFVYEHLLECIDGCDNGIGSQGSPEDPRSLPEGCMKNTEDETSLVRRIHADNTIAYDHPMFKVCGTTYT